MRTLLVVDDSKLARMAVTRAVATLRPDWRVVEAADADHALMAARDTRPDAAVIDFNMPGRDGLVLAGELRALHPQMPLALVTANAQSDVLSRARAVRAAFIPKPLQPEAFGAFLGRAEASLEHGVL